MRPPLPTPLWHGPHRHTVTALGVAWLAGLWTCTVRLDAQPAPRIEVGSIEVGAGSVFRFHFQGESNEAAAFEIETTSDLGAVPAWTRASTAAMESLGGGLFRVSDTISARQRYYRVRWGDGTDVSLQLWLNEVMTDNLAAYADAEGRFWDWIEIYNPNDEAVELSGYGLSDDEEVPGKWRFPAGLVQPHGYVMVHASDLDLSVSGQPFHANFKLKASGETVILSDRRNQVVDRLQVPVLGQDESLGRTPDGSDQLGVFPRASVTPGKANADTVIVPALVLPRFVPEGGYHAGPVIVSVVPGEAGHRVHYTLDGSVPTPASPRLDAPLRFEKPTVLRVMAVDAAGRQSASVAGTYLVGVRHTLPVISIATAPANMEFRNGYLYGMGPAVLNSQNQVLQNYPFSGSNAWKDREVEISVELFEPDGGLGLSQRAGMKVYGGWGSRGYPQKSLALFARRSYGAGSFKHKLFPDESVEEFESFVLRNSGNDNQSTHQTPPRPPITEFGATSSYGSYFVNGEFTLMRDALMQRLLEGTSLDTQGYRPSVVYINGDYWGIYNIREKITEHHVISHHDLAPGSIDLIEGYGSVRAGSGTVYTQLRQLLASRNMATPANFAQIEETYLDIDNFIDYHLAVIYFQNFDIGNIKCWRPRVARGRFRWLVYDQDYGFGLWPAAVYVPAMARDYGDYDNMFAFHTAGTGTVDTWPNGGGRTLMLRSLLNNPGFKDRFIRRCADLLNSQFREERVEQTIQAMASVIRPEIGAHLQRWSWSELAKRGYGRPHQPEFKPFVQATWETNLTVLSEFGRTRPAKLRQDCLTHFRLQGGLGTVEVDVQPAGAGIVQVNSLSPTNLPWRGVYFSDLSTTLRAIPSPGFRFAGWAGPGATPSTARVDTQVDRDTTSRWVARMEPASTNVRPSELVITEIQYNPARGADSGDWVELHNPTAATVDLTGWLFRDGDDTHVFPLPERSLAPGATLVLVQEDARFRLFHPASVPTAAGFGFGLGNEGDNLRLFRPDGSQALSVRYGDAAPWTPGADGTGFTLQPRSPTADPALPGSWVASPQKGGNPGVL